MHLPSLIPQGRERTFILFGILFPVVSYLSSNHYHLFQPVLLPLLEFEKNLPFLPWMIFPYISMYFYVFSVFWFTEDNRHLNRLAYSFVLTQIIALGFFLLYPTTYPRADFLNYPLEGLEKLLFAQLWFVDTPANCFPSLHVANVFLACLSRWRRSFFPLHLFIFIIISISTLGTKQHYFWDVLSGMLLAMISFMIFRKAEIQQR